MNFTLSRSRNTLSPSLHRRAKQVKDQRPLLKTMGLYTVQHTKRAFNEPGFRPHAWAPLATGGAATLRKNNVLARSPRLVTVRRRLALVGSDRKYAAIHQLGGRTRPHVIKARPGKALYWPGARHPVKQVNHPGSKVPARPFFPFNSSGRPDRNFKRRLNKVAKKKLDKMLGVK